jgi:hypothetical protein
MREPGCNQVRRARFRASAEGGLRADFGSSLARSASVVLFVSFSISARSVCHEVCTGQGFASSHWPRPSRQVATRLVSGVAAKISPTEIFPAGRASS